MADLMSELELLARQFRRRASDHQHDHEGDEYHLGVGRGFTACAEMLEALIAVQAPWANKAGRFENQGDGTARCAGCGFRIQGEVQAIKITLPKE